MTDYREELKQKLATEWEWREYIYQGDTVLFSDGEQATNVQVNELDEGRWNKYVEVITELPTGDYVAWGYEEGLTEMQESFGPAENTGTVKLDEREQRTETITVTRYVPKQ